MIDKNLATTYRRVVADIFALADRLLDGKLVERLRREVEEKRSLDAIAEGLRADDIVVSRETVRRWCADNGIDTSRQKAATA